MQPASQRRHSNLLLIILLVVFILLFIGALVFGIWAYGGMQDYKKNVDPKIAAAVSIAHKQTASAKDKEFVEKYKNPLEEYNGPATLGSIKLQYPRTWSAYVDEKGAGAVQLDGFLHPGFVPGVNSGTAFALRIEVVNQPFANQMKQFDAKVKSGTLKVSPYVPKQVPSVLGARVEGEINTGQRNTMVLLPLRDKTLKISTQSTQFLGDFDNTIMPNLKFVP
jgi:hypothetical protein